KLDPKTITDYAAVHDAVMTEADYKAIKLSAARSVTPLPNGRPGAPSHKPPWLTRVWSSPGVEHITEVRDGIPTTYRVELPSFMRPGAVNRLVHGLGSQAAARWGAGRGLNEQFEPLPQVGVGGTWSRLLVKLSQQHEFYNLRFVGINEDGNSQRNASGQRLGSNTETATTGVAFRFLGSLIPNRVSDWAARIKSALGFGVESGKGLIEDSRPGEKQVNQRGAPMVYMVADRVSTYRTSLRVANWVWNKAMRTSPAIVHAPNAAVLEMPAEHAYDLLIRNGMEIPPELQAAMPKPKPNAAVVQTLLPPEGGYVAHNGSTVLYSELHKIDGQEPLSDLGRALDDLHVDGEFKQKVLERARIALATPYGYVGLRDALAARSLEDGDMYTIADPNTKKGRSVVLRIVAERSDHVAPDATDQKVLGPDSVLNIRYATLLRTITRARNGWLSFLPEFGASKAGGGDGALNESTEPGRSSDGTLHGGPSVNKSRKRLRIKPGSIGLKLTSQLRHGHAGAVD